jgi:hypothetical protein
MAVWSGKELLIGRVGKSIHRLYDMPFSRKHHQNHIHTKIIPLIVQTCRAPADWTLIRFRGSANLKSFSINVHSGFVKSKRCECFGIWISNQAQFTVPCLKSWACEFVVWPSRENEYDFANLSVSKISLIIVWSAEKEGHYGCCIHPILGPDDRIHDFGVLLLLCASNGSQDTDEGSIITFLYRLLEWFTKFVCAKDRTLSIGSRRLASWS